MNFAEIENAWRSPRNRPSPAELEKLKMEFITDLRRRRRDAFGLLCLVLLPMVFLTGKLALHILWPDPALDAVDLSREWGVIPFFALPWIGWLVMVRLYRKHQARHPNYEASISASVAALLDENRTERTRYKVIAALLVVSVALLPVIVYQLRAVGKTGDEILIPAFVIYPAYVAAMVIWIVVHDRRKLLPRKNELETLLGSYG